MKLNKEPLTTEKVILNLSEHKCDPYIVIGEVVIALEKAGKPELKGEFIEKVVKEFGEKTLGDFLETCSDYVDLQII